jgi:hypothetical protein
MTASAVPILFERVCPKCLSKDRKEGGMFKFVLVAKSRAKEVKWRAWSHRCWEPLREHVKRLTTLFVLLLLILLEGAAPFGQGPASLQAGQGGIRRQRQTSGQLYKKIQPPQNVAINKTCAPSTSRSNYLAVLINHP